MIDQDYAPEFVLESLELIQKYEDLISNEDMKYCLIALLSVVIKESETFEDNQDYVEYLQEFFDEIIETESVDDGSDEAP